MRTLTATIAAALAGCILTAQAQVAVSPGYTPYMATVLMSTNSTHAKALLEVSSGTATNLASGLHATNLAVLEEGGALLKLFGAVADGQVLKRDGTNIVGSAAGTGDMTKAVYDAGDDGAVDEAAHATNADSATYAGLATNALEAAHATNADFATEASHATNADSATYAGLATNATYATLATNANEAAHATNADLATSATYAGLATNLVDGVHATNLAALETGGALLKLFGAVGDGEYLKRDGTNIVGGTPAGGGDLKKDGSVAMEAPFDLGDNAVTNVSAFYGDALTITNDASVGGLTVATNATVNNDLFVGNDLTVTNDLIVGGVLQVDEVDTDTLVITNSLTVSNMYVNAMVVTNAISAGSLSTTTNVTSAAVTGTNTVQGGIVTAATNVSSPVIYGGAITGTNTISGGVITATTNFSSPLAYLGNATVTNTLTAGSVSATTNVTTAAVTGTNSGTFGTLLSVTNAAITWGVTNVTQSGGTNYQLAFAGGASYPNTYLTYVMTGNVCFYYTTNRAAGRCRTVILYGNAKNGKLYFNSDFHLVGTLADGITVTNTYILSFATIGTYETNVFVSGQYAE